MNPAVCQADSSLQRGSPGRGGWPGSPPLLPARGSWEPWIRCKPPRTERRSHSGLARVRTRPPRDSVSGPSSWQTTTQAGSCSPD